MFHDPAENHYGMWAAMVIWILIYGAFLLFLPFYKKSQRKPSSVYIAFVVAYALEMFGIPMSMYIVTWILGRRLPDGILYGHTLNMYIGHWGMYICIALNLIGAALIIAGWRRIYRDYWSRDESERRLVTTGIYRYSRHPQYTGFMLMTLGMLFEWATLPMLIMWPILMVVYYRLARKEEREVEAQFGQGYAAYRENTKMFIPFIV
mgnify:CR=1 FL=1